MRIRFILICFNILILGQLFAQEKELIAIRNLSGADSEEAAIKINYLLENFDSNSAITQGYRSIALFIYAKSKFSPVEKIKYFRAGTRILDLSIQEDFTSLELRYLRFCVQTNAPFYLNYSSNIEEDKRLILANWNKISDEDLKHRIRNYMMRSKYCNDSEKKYFNNG